jgi:hypothetical protein
MGQCGDDAQFNPAGFPRDQRRFDVILSEGELFFTGSYPSTFLVDSPTRLTLHRWVFQRSANIFAERGRRLLKNHETWLSIEHTSPTVAPYYGTADSSDQTQEMAEY